MPVNYVPEGYHSVTPYLVVPGVARLIDFLKQAFEGVELHRSVQPDGRIMHAEVRVGDSMLMMGEPSGQFVASPGHLYLYVPDVDATYRRALEAGAVSISEPATQFYGDRNAGVKDPSGNTWWIGTHVEDVAPDELQRRAQAAMKQHSTT